MFDKEIKDITAALVSAGEIDQFAEMAHWRITETLRELGHHMGDDGYEEEATVQHLISEALHVGWFERAGEGVRTRLVVSDDYRMIGRRVLFSLDPAEAVGVYAAGRMLASRLSTSSKNWLSSASVSANRSESPGSRRQSVVGR